MIRVLLSIIKFAMVDSVAWFRPVEEKQRLGTSLAILMPLLALLAAIVRESVYSD